MISATILVLILSCIVAEPKVKVIAYVESLCPDCVVFTKNELYQLVNTPQLKEISDIEIVPFGKASVVSHDPLKFRCQHGEPECYGNTVELCSLKYYPENGLDLMNCMQVNGDFSDPAVTACYSKMGLDAQSVLSCAHGEEGPKLMLKASEATPKLSYVPSVKIDDELFTDTENLLAHVCMAYTGMKPDACRMIRPYSPARRSRHYMNGEGMGNLRHHNIMKYHRQHVPMNEMNRETVFDQNGRIRYTPGMERAANIHARPGMQQINNNVHHDNIPLQNYRMGLKHRSGRRQQRDTREE